MSNVRIPKRVSRAILQSFSAGVVPRIGLEHVAVGRKAEIDTLLNDIDEVVAEGGATFRIILGRYGSGKSFLGQLIRNYALQKNFVVMDADLSPTRRLTGSKDEGLNLYRELMANVSTNTRVNGGALSALLERWISDIQQTVIREVGIQPSDPRFDRNVDQLIRKSIDQIEGMVNAFDFSTIIISYWKGHKSGNEELKQAALRWLSGEYNSKMEARKDLGVRVIINDGSWYDYIKLFAHFVRDIGYNGLLLFVDEVVNLYKISHRVSRENNYERLLTIFNDTMQGKAQYLGVILGATPQMVEDTRRGLHSYEALRSRLEESNLSIDGYRDFSGPIIRLATLAPEEIFVLLQKIRDIHESDNGYMDGITDQQIEKFLKEIRSRIGADELQTPREIVRDFISILSILHRNPDATFEHIFVEKEFKPSKVDCDPSLLVEDDQLSDEDDVSPFTNFKL